MCGIAGNTKNERVDDAIRKISYRGPDDRGTFVDKNISLGHCRLSIIDLSQNAHQPMTREGLTIVYNGEIYNFKELGYKSTSDTEVILKGYKDEGVSFFSKLRGMWAFALYDKQKLILARDIFGIKPLYYSIRDDQIYFASELKSIRVMLGNVEPNTDYYYQFFNLGYFIAPQTCYKNVYKVMPGEILSWDIKKRKLSKQNMELSEGEEYLSFEETINLTEKALQESVNAHFVSDVPVGLLLSGGNDSSLLAALSAHKKPIAYHLEIKGSPDSDYAKKVSKHLGLELVSVEMSELMMKQQYEKLWSFIDEPTGDISIIPTSLIYSLIKGKSKVVLSGEGGDEMFGGYLRHNNLAGLAKMKTINLKLPYGTSKLSIKYINPILSRLRDLFVHNLIDVYLKEVKIIDFPIQSKKIKADLYKLYLNKDIKSSNNLFFDRFMYLPDNLMSKTDISSMSSSIEARVPFLDKKFLSFILNRVNPRYCLSPEYKNKIVLKKIMEKYLPKDLIYRSKKGFSFSFEKYGGSSFKKDAIAAIIFHRENANSFGLLNERKLLDPGNATLLIRKYPRFVFALITNWKIFL